MYLGLLPRILFNAIQRKFPICEKGMVITVNYKFFIMLIPFAVGYLIGSINLSIVVTKYIGKFDIRTRGSGNAGGTNVARTMGAKWGIGVIVAEISKGFIVGLLAKYIFPGDIFGIGETGAVISGAVAVLGCLIGNTYPCFHGFKGGKGVTTCAAIMGVVDYKILIILVAVFLIVFFASRMVSLGSVIASIGMPVSTYIVYRGKPYFYILVIITSLMCISLIWNHRGNIKRILNGTENKFSFGRKK